MNVLIIEDEKFAAEKLEDMLHEIDPEIKVLAKLGSITESAGTSPARPRYAVNQTNLRPTQTCVYAHYICA